MRQFVLRALAVVGSAAVLAALVASALRSGDWADPLLGLVALGVAATGLMNRRVLWAVRGEQRKQTSYLRAADARSSALVDIVRRGGPGSSAQGSRTIDRLGPDNEYARRVAAAGPGLIETFALQNRSERARDVLARAASGHRFDATSLVVAVKLALKRPHVRWAKSLLSSLAPRPLASLAKVIAQQELRPTDRHDAIVLYRAVVRGRHASALDRHNRLVFLELLAESGRSAELGSMIRTFDLDAVDAVQGNLLRANALRTSRAAETPEAAATDAADDWIAQVNEVFRADGLETIAVRPGDGPLMDRIVCRASTDVADGPLVTVIMPTFDPDERIETAIRSVLDQSYRNLEVLLMDDCSPPEGAARLDLIAEQDPRVTVVHLPENRGSYKARNVALEAYASGEFVTVHDDDDWSHPRKIERQVQHLLEHPDVPANMSMLSRATPDLMFTRINNNPVFTQPNFSSLMIRRSVLETLGYWDVVNRSADAEMRDRIAAWSGEPVPAVGIAPASFLRVRSASLTAGEIFKGYVDPRRTWYQRLTRAAHAERLAAGEPLWVGPDVRDDRPFAAPVGLLGGRDRLGVVETDVVYATDFRFPGGNSSVAVREITALVDNGYRVGLVQMDSPLLGPRNVLHPDVIVLLSAGRVQALSLLDQVRAPLSIVRHPSVLQYVNPVRSSIDTARVLVVANHPPYETGLTGSVYDISTAVSNAAAVFGVTPSVAPESGLIRELLGEMVDPGQLISFDWNGIVQSEGGRLRHAEPGRPFVIGRHSRDQALKWPSREVIKQVYPIDGSRDVRVLGGAASAAERLGKPAEHWTVWPFGSRDVAEFLDELDFWVYFHAPELFESFGMATAEAMAAGLVVVLPEYMEPTFGDGAVYCAPDEVQQTLDRLWADPEAYAAQSARALEFAQSRFAAKAFIDRVEAVGERPVAAL
ncbi:glycosyltransferase [Myceligenerans pegani]|uniref:Glycosyltransferase n=1 Tax=Myceligenerans pegani TaxID=2776917 RepID=A0ABR9N1G0_9MICO|nr:glycosyltransferase [Myceligenerans sp. TRM 65318]MBE1877121.1 glycosyltransferase [Myceligenerans sp. TRM 65318]MBE3019392.1 glycosyltransferase [Myceligenerans sp. TRM 65318]